MVFNHRHKLIATASIALGLCAQSAMAELTRDFEPIYFNKLPMTLTTDQAYLSFGEPITRTTSDSSCNPSELWVAVPPKVDGHSQSFNCIVDPSHSPTTSENGRTPRIEPNKIDETEWNYPRLSFTPEVITFASPSGLIISRYYPPSGLGKTRIIRFGYRDFKDCTDNSAVRIFYSLHFSVPTELTAHSLLTRYGGMPAIRFEEALSTTTPNDLSAVLELARSLNLGGDYLPNDLDCNDPAFRL